jgi:hypothetical protein
MFRHSPSDSSRKTAWISTGMSRLSDAAVPLVLLFLQLACLLPEWGPGQVIGSSGPDTDLSYYIGLRDFAFYGEGRFSFWNPYWMCGVPLAGEIQSGLFYPPNWMYLLLPLPIAMNLSLLLHWYLLSLFTFAYARQIGLTRMGGLIAAAGFCFCAPVFLRLFAGHHSNFYTIAWIPAVFMMIHRIGRNCRLKEFVGLGLVFALQILAGHSQYFFYTVLFAWLYLVFVTRSYCNRNQIQCWLRFQLGFGLSLGTAFLIALPQIVPVLEMLSLSARSVLSPAEVGHFSFPPQNLITFLAPRIYGDGIDVPYWGLYNFWEMCGYVGIMALLLAGLAATRFRIHSHVVFFLGIAAAAGWIALGEHTPLFELLYHGLPGFRMFRGHSKAIVFCGFAVALLAGIGFEALKRPPQGNLRSRNWIYAAVGLFSIALLMLATSDALIESVKSIIQSNRIDPRTYLPVPGFEDAAFIQAAVEQSVVALRFIAIGILIWMGVLVGFRYRPRSRFLAMLVCGIVLAEGLLFASTFSTSVSIDQWNLQPGHAALLSRDESLRRSALVTSHGPKYGSTSRIHQITGDYPYVLRRYSRVFNFANEGHPEPSMKIGGIRRISPIYGLMNLKYLIAASEAAKFIPGYTRIYDDGTTSVFQSDLALDRIYLPSKVKIAADADEAFRSLVEPETIRGEQAVIEMQASGRDSAELQIHSRPADADEYAAIVEYKADRVKIQTRLSSDGWLVLADTYYPGWKAILDGTVEIPIFRANYLFRAVHLPQGTHEIVFQYRPTHLSGSLIITLITLFGCLAVVLRTD